MITLTTLIYLRRPDEILLYKPTSGPCIGKYSSFGGKMNADEGDKTLLDCAVRETAEETGLTIKRSDFIKTGVITFRWEKEIRGFGRAGEKVTECHIYTSSKWTGDIRGTNFVTDPHWFSISDLPWTQMMPGDKTWMSSLVDNKQFTGELGYRLDSAGDVINTKAFLDSIPNHQQLAKL